ncbi:hypothetical protein [Saccharopolyspora spinosa]|uniref:Phage integrase family protein n=1 Tax=Saccharopolyspora spinosa TaxID=60894 RepID=A0A2N3YA87_SACSN|nr:hypothetical protein [Saccharopolyspora spinosa]PKW19761.1 hypothetical protein A8926_7950 [Saccharopolyspora spinosa]
MTVVKPLRLTPSAQAAELLSPLESAHFPEDHHVLEGWSRRQGGPDPRFGELRWDLTAAISTPNLHPCERVVDFRRITDPVRRLTAMEFIAARLTKRHTAMKLLTPSAANQILGLLMRFNVFLDSEYAGCAYSEVTQPMLDDYLRWTRQGRKDGHPGPSDRSLATYIRVIKTLWLYRDWLTHDTLSVEPWNGKSSLRAAGARMAAENTTDRIPEPVMAALLRWALFYVHTAAEDILAARREHRDLQSHEVTYKRAEAIARLRAFIAKRRAAGRGLPGRRPDLPGTRPQNGSVRRRDQHVGAEINLTLLAKLAGYNDRLHDRDEILDVIAEGVQEIGLEPGGYDTPITVCPETGLPWREPLDSKRIDQESNHLLAACYVVIAYLTGARDSEVQGLERGCHFTEATGDGVLVRHKIRGWVTKRRGSAPQRAVWVTLPDVARAIDVLERLTDKRYLFTRPNRGSALAPASEITEMINRFAEHVVTLADRTGLPPIPPVTREGIDGQTTTDAWWFTTRQFRRTLAWHIARQPFGLVAGKIQYQQASVSIFEGYAGTSESGFRAEVEKERAEAQLDDIVERYEDDLCGRPFTGGAAARLKSEFARVRAELGDFPGRRADRARVREMLRGLARTFRVGVLADCAFDDANPDAAVCLSESNRARKVKRTLPILDACQPGNCANACQTSRHRPAWERMVAEVDEHLKDKKINDVQRDALLRQRKAWQGILDRLQDDTSQVEEP